MSLRFLGQIFRHLSQCAQLFFSFFLLSDINFTPSKLEILAIEGFIFRPASLYLRILSKVLTGIFMHSNTA